MPSKEFNHAVFSNANQLILEKIVVRLEEEIFPKDEPISRSKRSQAINIVQEEYESHIVQHSLPTVKPSRSYAGRILNTLMYLHFNPDNPNEENPYHPECQEEVKKAFFGNPYVRWVAESLLSKSLLQGMGRVALSRIIRATIQILRQASSATDYRLHDSDHGNLPPTYTYDLTLSRGKMIEDLGAALRNHLKPYLHPESYVLEIGPGSVDILYSLLHFEGDTPPFWVALDIHPGVIESLSKMQMRGEVPSKKYLCQMASIRTLDTTNFFLRGRTDTVIALSSLDSVVDFHGISRNIYSLLKPGGYLILVQDLPPSYTTLWHLASSEPTLELGQEVLFYEFSSPLSPGGVTHLDFPGISEARLVQSHLYLHRRWKAILAGNGFIAVDEGLRQYSDNPLELYSLCNRYLQIYPGTRKLAQNLPILPHYAYLIMEKKG
ncbi:class I SAM-dependent methyltransferase [Candidatus Woesearchaeota archaeon]|nr:class I SAM-dependent methyltransferase [Candidatus Woesearchaeota archaeon]